MGGPRSSFLIWGALEEESNLNDNALEKNEPLRWEEAYGCDLG
jgi:hypothetical protein